MTSATAAHLASLLAREARRLHDFDEADEPESVSAVALEARARVVGVVRALTAGNGSHAAVGILRQPKTRPKDSDTEWLRNKQFWVQQSFAHPLCCNCDTCLNGCSFPSAGIPVLFLRVAEVNHAIPNVEFEGKDCPEPFSITIETEDDPSYTAKNKAVFDRLLKGSGDA
jgi:hypothetical protein